jgi:hypothetical protein
MEGTQMHSFLPTIWQWCACPHIQPNLLSRLFVWRKLKTFESAHHIGQGWSVVHEKADEKWRAPHFATAPDSSGHR